MADRFPLILNTSANQIQEIASGDQLDLSGNNIANAGIITAGNVTIGAATTDLLVNGDARITGILTIGTSSITLDEGNNTINVGTALTLGHTQGLQFHTQNLHSTGFEVNQINASGIITATQADINGDLDVDGHTNLDNVSVAGVVTATTFVGALTGNVTGNVTGNITGTVSGNATGLTGTPNISVGTISGSTGTFSGAIDANGDLDVDGHTNLDNVSVAGVTTFANTVYATTINNAAAINLNTGSGSNVVINRGITVGAQGISVSGGIHGSNITLSRDLDVDGHTNLDNVSIAGVSTFTGAIDANGDLDVDGHTNLDNISVSGVSTFAGDATFNGNVSIGGTLTYEDVSNIDSVGIVTARSGLVSPNADIDDFISVGSNIHLGNAGVVTATSFVGSGAALTGIDATSIKDSGGNVKIQAQASGAVHSGISTFNEINLGDSTGSGNNRLKFGVGNEFQIWHNSVHSMIENSTGALWIKSTHAGHIYLYTGGSHGIYLEGDDGHVYPSSDSAIDIGSNAVRFRNSYFDNVSAGSSIAVGTGVTVESNGQATYVGIVTASAFKLSDGSNVGGVESDSNSNTVGGTDAGNALDGDTYSNTLFGASAGYALNSGDDNTAVGRYALQNGTSASRNSILGYSAGRALTSGTNNVLLGYQAGTSITTSGNVIAIGYQAADSLTTGVNNVVLGSQAGQNMTDASNNVIIGHTAGYLLTSASSNTYIGRVAGYLSNPSGFSANTAVGEYSGYGMTSATFNAFFGQSSGYQVTSGSQNTILGRASGTNITTGSNNIVIGYDTTASSATTSNEITLGNSSINHLRVPGIGVSFSEGGAVISGIATFSGTEAIFNRVSFPQSGNKTIVGNMAGGSGPQGSEITCVGYGAGYASSGDRLTAIGRMSGRSVSGTDNTCIGYEAGYSNLGAQRNVFVGKDAGMGNKTGSNNIVVGSDAGEGVWNNANYSNSVILGAAAGSTLTSSNSNVIVIGYDVEPSSNSVTNEITLGNSNISKFRIPGINVILKDNGGTPTQGHVLTVDGNGEAGFAAVSADLVNDTSPQLGGVLDAGVQNIIFADSNGSNTGQLRFGAMADLRIYHASNHNYISGEYDGIDTTLRGRRDLYLQCGNNSSGYRNVIYADNNGTTRLYHPASNAVKLQTSTSGVTVLGTLRCNISNADAVYIDEGSNLKFTTGAATSSTATTGTVSFDARTYDTDKARLHKWTSPNVGGGSYGQYSEAWYDGGSYRHITSTSSGFQLDHHLIPSANNSLDLGTSSVRWRNLYTNDLNLSNEGSSNDVDGTWGNYTIQEGENDLFLINKRNGKKYKFNLTEVS